MILIVSVCAMAYYCAVDGKSNSVATDSQRRTDKTVEVKNRTKRDIVAATAVVIIYGVSLASMSIANSNRCSVETGCHNGKCWAWCGVSLSGGEWCYTTRRNSSQSYEYVSCTSEYDCDKCWKCGGPCTL